MKKTLLSILLGCMFLGAWADSYKTTKDIPYIADSDTSAYRKERCKLDIYYPTDKKGFKTLVWFHGGALEAGHKEIPNLLQGKGFAVVGVNYRLFPKGKNPEYTVDAAEAVAWVYKHIREYGGNPSEVYVAGHSAGGYLTLMLCLDKSYLNRHGVDADSIRGYFPVSGQCATHYTIRKERKQPFDIPLVDTYAPLNHARKLGTKLVLITGGRKQEQMARYEENAYLKAVLEGIGNPEIPLYEIEGFDHGQVYSPACLLIEKLMKK